MIVHGAKIEAKHEIQVWVRQTSRSHANPDDLLPAEQTRADSIASPGRRAEFMCGRALARRAVGAALGINPHEVGIATSDDGRPCLVGEVPLDFSVSHSTGLVVVAVAWHTRLGVDVEAMRPARALAAVADRLFSPRERALLESVGHDQWCRTFHDIWTCKEAYLKALGLAMFPNCRGTSVAPSEGRIVRGITGDAPERWRLKLLAIASTHRASLCWDARGDDDWIVRLHDERG